MKIKITNNSSLDNNVLLEYINAIQIQLDTDFQKWYGYKTSLSLDNGDYEFILEDRTDRKGALGYHCIYNNIPLAKIFVKDINDNSKKVSVAMSHEIMEMVNNPYANKTILLNNKLYLYECCDPTQCDELGYKINDIIVSNFVTPHWFNQSSQGCFDFRNRIKEPFQILRRCYANVMNLPSRNWIRIGPGDMIYNFK